MLRANEAEKCYPQPRPLRPVSPPALTFDATTRPHWLLVVHDHPAIALKPRTPLYSGCTTVSSPVSRAS